MEDFRDNITITTRKIVIDWMHEVCEELCSGPGGSNCSSGGYSLATCNQLYVHAVHNLDRFMTTCKIVKRQLQLAAAVCILISAKTFGIKVTINDICEYTDYCFNPDEVVAWEALVLTKLNWYLRLETPEVHAINLLTALRCTDLKPKVVDLIVMSTAEPDLSLIAADRLAIAAIEVILAETKSPVRVPIELKQMETMKVVQQLRSLLEDDFDSDYGSCISGMSADFDNYYKEYKSVNNFGNNDELSFRVSHL